MAINIPSSDYEFVSWSHFNSFQGGSASITFAGPAEASAFLHRLAGSTSMQALRAALGAEEPGADLRYMDDSEVIEQLSQLLVQQRFRIARKTPEMIAMPSAELAAPQPESAAEPGERASIRIVIVEDKTWKPISGVKLTLILPNGAQEVGTTGTDGSIEHWGIAPGRCDLRSSIDGASLANSFEVVQIEEGEPPAPVDDGPPEKSQGRRFALILQPYKVTHRDTLASVARSFALTWQQLAEFNFGTSAPREVNRHLRDNVGCRKQAEEGENYVFDDADDPGLLYVPGMWSWRGLATNRTHTLRVRVPVIAKPKKKLFLFSV